ncbi:hypothetical protein GQ85_10985 [Rhodococcus rhodochrous]|nr:hypothetical protein GQ85_10985 [Rhodococcus rhodochrous]
MTVLPGYARPTRTSADLFDIEVGAPDALTWRPLGSYMTAEFDWHWYLPTTAVIEIQPDHPMAGYLVNCRRTVIHIRTWHNGIPWDGRVMKATVKGKPGRETITLTCISNLFWLLRGLAWVNNLTPPEFQLSLTGKQSVMLGPPDFVFKWYLAQVMTRLRKPVYAALPIRYTVPTLPNLEDIDTLDDALTIVADALDDLCILSARFTQLDELFKQTVENTEIGLSCHLWTPADGTASPSVFNTHTLSQLQSVLDMTSDNFLNFSNPGNVLGLTDPSQWGTMQRAGYVFDTHVKRDMRKLQWRTDGGQIEYYERETEHADASRVIIGGKAPEIANQIVEWGANFALQLILNLLLPGANLGTILVGDLFDDILFAYQQFWDPDLEDELGEHGFGEVFGDNTAAWSFDGAATGLNALKAHSGTDAIKIVTTSGGPDGRGYSMGVDDGTGRRYQVGDIHTFWDKGVEVEKTVTAVKVSDRRDGRKVETITLGEDKALRDGWQRIIAQLQGFAGTARGIANSV